MTGLISGVAPSTPGEYVVAVYVKEWRKGVLIAQLKKELQIYVFNCSLVGAALNDSYVNCKDYTYTFQNESTNSSITSYSWDFGVKSLTNDTSSQPVPTYTYPDTGVYILKLKVGTANGCLDSTTAPVKVFPGFTPDFSFSGSCYQSPIQFTNTSIVKYGTPAFSWDFGEPASLTNISTLSNPTHQYAAPGNETVTLQLSSSKGCVDTISKQVVVTGKPDIALPFRDTLICSIDSLPLIVNSVNAGSYQWTPAYNIINASSAHPIVYPKDTTVYTVVVQDKGCIDSASITVNVLDYITVSLTADTTICATDSITLRPATYGLSFQWSPAASLSSSTVKYPLAAPASTTTYTVLANLGKCQASASQKIRVVPYPGANAGPDTTICFGASAVLHGSLTANSFTWSPLLNVFNSTTLHPTVSPLLTTNYVLTVMDTLGCPKPVSDTVLVTVLPKIGIDAGRDTSIVVGQPLQLQAIAAASNLQYSWSPSTWLNNSSIANPVAQINNNTVDSIYYTVTVKNPASCAASDGIHVLVYKTLPDIFVPSAFTPNGDGRNDFMHPILIGIRQLNYFRIYNRWGQLIFSSAQNNSSWDGRLSGQLQDPGSYVYVVSAVDYLGKRIFRKGSFVLIR
ncbi:MAG: gliding motility-associated C-terminal domain-containing protein [Bacteroidota bacterium]|nr:gliding motility-associated C-terminal domain-containing protein [Bacteroidota bacterium]